MRYSSALVKTTLRVDPLLVRVLIEMIDPDLLTVTVNPLFEK